MKKVIPVVGTRYHMLTILREVAGKKGTTVECQCECGNVTTAAFSDVRRGNTKSCGCLKQTISITHGASHTKLYHVWDAMVQRTSNPNNKKFSYYGARGITVCDSWKSSFSTFQQWALAHGYQEGLTIERTDPDKGYSPDNCVWASRNVQMANRRKRGVSPSKYIGVQQTPHGKWLARVMYNGKRLLHHLADTEMEAVKIRDQFIKENGLPHRRNITE